MKILIAPDSFKGTATAVQAARALADGWRSVRPHDDLVLLPMADGGEGTLEAVASATPGTEMRLVPGCTGPDGRSVDGAYAMLPDGTALVELAVASGLPLLEGRLAPLTATTRGTGETIARALDDGARRLVVALGGSASTDGGAGLLSALGLRLLDADGRPLTDGGGALVQAATADLTALRPPPPGGVLLLSDVTNPLRGPEGAATVYGPQKGAGPGEVAHLDRGLARLATLLGGEPEAPGAGAAGGTAYGLAAAWDARLVPGAVAIADLLALDSELDAADLLITGEGCFDRTSALGKAVGESLHRAQRAGTSAAVVAGRVAAADDRAHTLLSLTALAGDDVSARAHAPHWLRRAGATLAAEAF
ncbi:glycerate kinase [Streptomyces sp. LMG1-1-1.1]|uniref:glycerate kinase n=1 Tax=Streptomyces sp. LMG1-1-1.1 TaxID=3135245 RepID=UPI003465E59E